MADFQLSSLRNASVWGLYRLKDKRQLLIDTIVNQFDVPKIYLHKFSQPMVRDGKLCEFAVIDGKQRLTAIWAFIDGKFALASDFSYLKSEDSTVEIEAAALTYADLARKYPDVKTDFDSYALDVVCIETDDPELIEDLFSRLNEAVPLSAPEKRNALPGPLPSAVRMLAQHQFFTAKLPFSNRRYRHYDLAAKMLLIVSRDEVTDTKKAYLDNFFREGRTKGQSTVAAYENEIDSILNGMRDVFVDDDPLLRQIGMTVLYFHLFRRARGIGSLKLLHREAFVGFDEDRLNNRSIAETDLASADYRLLEFDRFTQSPNDAYAMRIRLAIIDERTFGGKLGFPPVVGSL
jgi:Protein of unknown function DUF262